MKKSLFIMLCGAMLMAACKKDNKDDDPVKTLAERTVMVYMSGDNNLASAALSDIKEMEQGAAGIPANSHLVVFVDRATGSEKPFIAEIKNNQQQPLDTLYKYPNDFYASDPDLFCEVLQRIATELPAKEYGLVLWGHGSGWVVEKDSIAQKRAYGVDNTGNNQGGERWMNLTQMAKALKNQSVLPKLNYIFADCCNMMCVEVGYEPKDVTEYLIGAPSEIPGWGAPYDKMVPQLFKSGSNLYRGIIDTYYDYYADFNNLNYAERNTWPYMKDGYSVPLSVIDTKYVGDLADRTHDMLERAVGGYPQYPQSPDLTGIMFYLYNPIDIMYDMRAIMERLLSAEDFATWDKTYQQTVPYYRKSMMWMTEFQPQYQAFFGFDKNLQYGCVSMFIPRQGQYYSYGNMPYNKTSRNFAWSRIMDWERFGWE